jgi:uncharacterized RDD family membrane protein YckC
MTPGKITDRFLAYLIDTLPFGFGYYLSLILLVARWHVLPLTPMVIRAAMLVWLAIYVLYHALGAVNGGTVGKRLLGLRVVGMDGKPLGIGRALMRALGLLISTPLFNLGFIWALINPQSRTWHDLLASSQVIESGYHSPEQSRRRALLALLALVSVFLINVWFYFLRPSPQDREAVAKAREGLKVIAQMEEAYKSQHGTYTNRLGDLAAASGDPAQFKQSMLSIFDPDEFRIGVSPNRYLLSAHAKDSRRTVVTLSGP